MRRTHSHSYSVSIELKIKWGMHVRHSQKYPNDKTIYAPIKILCLIVEKKHTIITGRRGLRPLTLCVVNLAQKTSGIHAHIAILAYQKSWEPRLVMPIIGMWDGARTTGPECLLRPNQTMSDTYWGERSMNNYRRSCFELIQNLTTLPPLITDS